jgi:HEAT repeat protein
MARGLLPLAGAVVLVGGAALLYRAHPGPVPSPPTSLPTSSPRAPQVGAGATAAEPFAELLDELRAEPDPVARRARVAALRRRPDAAAALGAVARSDVDGAAREEALVALAALGGAEGVALLAAVARDDPRMGARAGAALATVSDHAAAAALAALLAGAGPVIVRANAARALAGAGTPAEEKTLATAACDPAEAQRVRQEAALALARVGTPAVVGDLVAALERAVGDPAPEAEQLRISLAQALGGIGGEAARAALSRHRERGLSMGERAFVERALAQRK